MRSLEQKIPPPAAAVLAAAAMWATAQRLPRIGFDHDARLGLAAVFALAGLLLAVTAALSFRRARTTLHPTDPSASTVLVTDGVFRYTRNPMYLGLAALLVGWTIYLAVPLALLGPALFAIFITRFQIVPEERALADKFGKAYAQYENQVRRWL